MMYKIKAAMQIDKARDRWLGAENKNNSGYLMKVVDYKDAKDVTIQWECGQIQKVSSGNFNSGSIKYLNEKTLYGVGYIGYGKYVLGKPSLDEIGVPSVMVNHWRKMVSRVNSEKYLREEKNVNYRDTTIQESWYNFQNFCEWAFEQKGWDSSDEKGNKFQLDKDILNPNNKQYCGDFCVFVPQALNIFFSKKIVGKFGRGVKEVSKNGFVQGYTANVSEGNVERYLGFFSNPQDAMNEHLKEKKSVAKRLAVIWDGLVDERVIERLGNFNIQDILSE